MITIISITSLAALAVIGASLLTVSKQQDELE
jgi:hypothetical protein